MVSVSSRYWASHATARQLSQVCGELLLQLRGHLNNLERVQHLMVAFRLQLHRASSSCSGRDPIDMHGWLRRTGSQRCSFGIFKLLDPSLRNGWQHRVVFKSVAPHSAGRRKLTTVVWNCSTVFELFLQMACSAGGAAVLAPSRAIRGAIKDLLLFKDPSTALLGERADPSRQCTSTSCSVQH